ncbi:hypothetical protein PTSG_12588 [Salpingoeca rosetta]|uniref:Zeta toxin domain-containing protein n=1 Tax=Salpingoeca rosetta (strain ATCC 50818 / BSB-021) TaxID=946362 RepID=F2UIS4_SALR5|nr:uncharacterized protein PTSG_12588 [Salpingoeca rosetta]EGD77123.1 hypothetical protein PTSG_12588 [Salpingoeca rosetta]|eukprot:XP_004990962.1 hypothetical protein PTSG_12588 [Salpingoeca rosetta]
MGDVVQREGQQHQLHQQVQQPRQAHQQQQPQVEQQHQQQYQDRTGMLNGSGTANASAPLRDGGNAKDADVMSFGLHCWHRLQPLLHDTNVSEVVFRTAANVHLYQPYTHLSDTRVEQAFHNLQEQLSNVPTDRQAAAITLAGEANSGALKFEAHDTAEDRLDKLRHYITDLSHEYFASHWHASRAFFRANRQTFLHIQERFGPRRDPSSRLAPLDRTVSAPVLGRGLSPASISSASPSPSPRSSVRSFAVLRTPTTAACMVASTCDARDSTAPDNNNNNNSSSNNNDDDDDDSVQPTITDRHPTANDAATDSVAASSSAPALLSLRKTVSAPTRRSPRLQLQRERRGETRSPSTAATRAAPPAGRGDASDAGDARMLDQEPCGVLMVEEDAEQRRAYTNNDSSSHDNDDSSIEQGGRWIEDGSAGGGGVNSHTAASHVGEFGITVAGDKDRQRSSCTAATAGAAPPTTKRAKMGAMTNAQENTTATEDSSATRTGSTSSFPFAAAANQQARQGSTSDTTTCTINTAKSSSNHHNNLNLNLNLNHDGCAPHHHHHHHHRRRHHPPSATNATPPPGNGVREFVTASSVTMRTWSRAVTVVSELDELEEISTRHRVCILLFAADYCNSCRSLKPEYQKAAEMSSLSLPPTAPSRTHTISAATTNNNSSSNRDAVAWLVVLGPDSSAIRDKFGIKRYPTILRIADGAVDVKRSSTCPRTAAALLAFAHGDHGPFSPVDDVTNDTHLDESMDVSDWRRALLRSGIDQLDELERDRQAAEAHYHQTIHEDASVAWDVDDSLAALSAYAALPTTATAMMTTAAETEARAAARVLSAFRADADKLKASPLAHSATSHPPPPPPPAAAAAAGTTTAAAGTTTAAGGGGGKTTDSGAVMRAAPSSHVVSPPPSVCGRGQTASTSSSTSVASSTWSSGSGSSVDGDQQQQQQRQQQHDGPSPPPPPPPCEQAPSIVSSVVTPPCCRIKGNVPHIVFTGGGIGSGKSSALRQLHASPLWSQCGPRFLHIEADALKDKDPLFKALKGVGQSRASEVVHHQSTRTAEGMLAVAVAQRRHIVFDSTMMWRPFVEQTVAMLRDCEHEYRRGPGYVVGSGGGVTETYWEQVKDATTKRPYRLTMLAVTAPPHVAVRRAILRWIVTGRAPSPTRQVLASHKMFSANFRAYARMFDEILLFDNGDDSDDSVDIMHVLPPTLHYLISTSHDVPCTAKLIAVKSVDDSDVRVVDIDAYVRFLKKADLNPAATCAHEVFEQA